MFSTLGLLIIVFLRLTSARNDSLSKNHQFPNQNLTLSDTSFDNKTLFYALYARSTKQCSVIQEINPFTNYSVTKKCSFVLKTDDVQLIVSFGSKKAILITQEATPKVLKLTAITVHMSDCRAVDAELAEVPLNWTQHQFHRDYIDVVVSEQSGFEVIIKGLSYLCTKPHSKVYCGVSFDADGKKIEGPLIWPKMAYEKIDIVSPVMADASGQGYFFVNRDSSLLVFQLNRKGGPKYVKLWYTPIPHTNLWREAYSVANHVDGMCYNVNSTIGCWQTDQDGEPRVQVEFEFDRQFKANLRQCNNTTLGKTIQESNAQETTTQASTIELSTAPETTVDVSTARESTTASDTATEEDTIKESVTGEATEDAEMEPITVKGITLVEVDESTTVSTMAEDTIPANVTSEDNTTESNGAQDSTIQTNATQESATESDARQNSVSDGNTTQDTVAMDNVTLIDITKKDNAALENTTEYNTAQDITVQGLTTQDITTQHDTVTENAAEGTTAQDVTLQAITVQGITIQDSTTQKNLALRSLSQVKSMTGEQKVWNLFIHNLRSGGFVVLVVTCPNRICSGNEDHYYLMKINAQGRLIGQLEVNIKSKCNAETNEVFAKAFENDQGQYCSVRLCKSKHPNEEQLEILVNCYCNSDFK